MARWLVTATSEFEADVICQALKTEGIGALTMSTSPEPATFAGPRDIYVDQRNLDQARAIVDRAREDSAP